MPEPYFHVGVVVDDLDAAMDELSRALGLHWCEPIPREVGEWRYRLVYSLEGPPYIELIEGSPGSPWDPSGGSRLDHLGYWSDDIDAEQARLEGKGVGTDVDMRSIPGGRAVYLRAPASGLRIELNNAAGREALEERLSGSGPGTSG